MNAFDGFFEETRRPLRAFLARSSGDEALADDLLQEAYLRVLAFPPREEDPRAQRAYLFTTATRLLQAHWKRQRPMPWLPWRDPGDEDPLEMLPGDQPCPERQMADRQVVALGWARLTPRQRSLLWLAYVEGLDHGELAQALGLRLGSVKVLLHRARQRMASTLETLGLGGLS